MKIFIFEGPPSRLAGWRDYLICFGITRRSFLSESWKARRTAEIMHAQFFPAGAWEDQTKTAAPGRFSFPKPEILAAMDGGIQGQLGL